MTHTNQWSAQLRQLAPLVLPPETPGIYLSLLANDLVRIDRADDIETAHIQDPALHDELILAVLPGGVRVLEKVREKTMAVSERYEDMNFVASEELVQLVANARNYGFTLDEIKEGIWKGAERTFLIDDGREIPLRLSYDSFTEPGELIPSAILTWTCPACQKVRDSLDFLNQFDLLGDGTVLLNYSERCCHCVKSMLLPAVAVLAPTTLVRLHELPVKNGGLVKCAIDSKLGRWLPLGAFTIRMTEKEAKEGEKNSTFVMKLHPSVPKRKK